MNMEFFSSEGDEENMLFGGVKMKEYIESGNYSKDDFAPYIAPKKQDILEALQKHLCRCGSHARILSSINNMKSDPPQND